MTKGGKPYPSQDNATATKTWPSAKKRQEPTSDGARLRYILIITLQWFRDFWSKWLDRGSLIAIVRLCFPIPRADITGICGSQNETYSKLPWSCMYPHSKCSHRGVTTVRKFLRRKYSHPARVRYSVTANMKSAAWGRYLKILTAEANTLVAPSATQRVIYLLQWLGHVCWFEQAQSSCACENTFRDTDRRK